MSDHPEKRLCGLSKVCISKIPPTSIYITTYERTYHDLTSPGAGVQCVIARSFAFIYGRNQPNLGLLGFTIKDDAFYAAATEGAEIEITLDTRTVRVGGKEFEFQLTDLELSLLVNRGMTEAYKRFGKNVFESLRGGAGSGAEVHGEAAGGEKGEAMAELATRAIDDPEGTLPELQW